MRNGVSRRVVISAAVVAAVVGFFALTASRSASQAVQATQPARPSQIDGKPNLNGIWQVMNTANWDLVAHDVKPAVAQRGVYANHPVLAAPVVALGSVGTETPGHGSVDWQV